VVRARLARRDAVFLAVARDLIYAHLASPYRRLLALAGCEYGDLERMVAHEGVEETLQTLFRCGVYLRVEEYKGRRPTVRGSASFTVSPDQLRNPRSSVHLRTETSGSRGHRTVVGMDLANLREKALNLSLCLDARRAGNWVHACWTVPGGSTMSTILRMSRAGAFPVRWFSQVDPASPDLHARYAWGATLLAWGGRAVRLRLPRPEYAPLDSPLPVLRWLTGMLRAGRIPHLHTYPSSAVRLCEAATDAGVDIAGAQFTIGGEPVTDARLDRIRRTGSVAVPHYAAVEAGHIGYGCLMPQTPDEVHLLHDLHGLIQAGSDGPAAGLPADAMLLTSLRPTSPLVLFNVSLGDQATVEQRDCGCPLEHLGWTTHLRTIRSHEKLTAGGMSFLDHDLGRVLEEDLPRRFGGVPTDYQLLETRPTMAALASVC
jgi:hypothetical protein